MAQNFKPGSKDWIDWVSENVNRHGSAIRELAIQRIGKVWIEPNICNSPYNFVNGWDQAGDPYEAFAYRLYDVDNFQVKGTLTGGVSGTIGFRLLPPFWPKKNISIYGNVEVTAQVVIAILQIDHTTGDVTVNYNAPV